MRRLVLLLSGLGMLLTLFSLVLTSDPQVFAEDDHLPVTPPPFDSHWVLQDTQAAEAETAVAPTQERTQLVQQLLVAGDSCETAAELLLSLNQPLIGTQFQTNSLSTQPTDPDLSTCMNWNPSSPQGYRTAWYQLTAPGQGTLIVSSQTNQDYRNNYDTVIAIYTGGCGGTLTKLTCDDDHTGYLSEARTRVSGGETIYIEVVDYQLATSGPAVLNLQVEFVGDPSWEIVDTAASPISRHALVTDGRYLYRIGGQTELGSAPVRTGEHLRYDTLTRQWTPLTSMPAAPTTNGEGYSNVQAVRLGDEIHLPTGFVGQDGAYSAEHWVYSITNNDWRTITPQNPPWAITGFDPVAYAGVVPSGVDGRFFLVGGLAGKYLGADASDAVDEVRVSGGFFQFDRNGTTASNNSFWVNTLPLMTKPRYDHTAALVGGRVCAVGGLTAEDREGSDGIPDTNVLIPDGECFIPGTGWTGIAALNTPRYRADSVAVNGRWYVFGGIDEQGDHVASIEVWDINNQNGGWQTLPANFSINAPALAWPQGVAIDNFLWVVGGEQQNGPRPVNLVQRTPLPGLQPTLSGSNLIFLPLISRSNLQANTTPATAQPLPINTPFDANFSGEGDIYRVFAVDHPGGLFRVDLTNIPASSNYDLFVYTPHKQLAGSSQNFGTANESIGVMLTPARFYVFVVRDAPPPSQPPFPQPFRLVVIR